MAVATIEASAGFILTNEDPSVVVFGNTKAEVLDEDSSIIIETKGLPFTRPHYLTYVEVIDEGITKP
jgi:hypothetical protein